jgi:tetratricopeptide (TPR) repeat protein
MNRCVRLVLWVLFPVLAASASAEEKPAARSEPAVSKPVKHYLEARKLLYDDDLASAIELFERVVREHGDSEVADDALYWAAWCRARTKDGRPRAVEAWLRLLKRYPESPWIDETAAALRDAAPEEAKTLLKARFPKVKTDRARNRILDAMAVLGDEGAFPALWLRMTTHDEDAANALSRAGKAGAVALEDFLTDEGRSPSTRGMALRHWARAVLTERTVPLDRARKVVAKIAKDPMLVESTREIRALAAALSVEQDAAKDEEDLRDAVRRLRTEISELKKQMAELEKLLEPVPGVSK